MNQVIDISANNGIVNWSAIKKAGEVTDVFIRATLGCTDQDKILVDNAKNAAKAGLNVSYYHVAYPGTKFTGAIKSNAIKQATNFMTALQGLPKPKWLAVDLETQITIDDFEFSTWLNAFLERVESVSMIEPLIYTYQSYLDEHLPKDHKFGSYRLWIANYNKVDSPKLPIGWSNYYLWQFTDKGLVPGIKGNVDISKLFIPEAPGLVKSTSKIPEAVAKAPSLLDKFKNFIKLS